MSLIITGVLDATLPGGNPKVVELYVTADISDLSIYGLGSANNGLGTNGEEFSFPPVQATAGSFIYVSAEAIEFQNFFGFAPDYTSGAVAINGDDAIELFQDGTVIDTFGQIDIDGTGTEWEYHDGWAYRRNGATASPTFDIGQWDFSGPDALDGVISNTDGATAAFPTGSFEPTAGSAPVPVFTINEIDADNPGTDTAEFIEIYDGGVGNSALDGLKVVLFNGNGDSAYDTIPLDGYTTDADGFFVIGSADVANVDLIAFTSNGLQNGADAVALYDGEAPTLPTTDNLLDAIVYDTADLDDPGLLSALGQTVQYDERANGDSAAHALARDVDGTGTFVAQAPTPGESNAIPLKKIHEIQGSAGTQDMAGLGIDDKSPLVGQTVTVHAIVTASFQSSVFGSQGDLNGFYIQEEDADQDGNDLTSEGLFVFDGLIRDVDLAVGDLVEITGTVKEFGGQTQISATFATVLDTAQTLPTAVEVVFPTAGVALDSSGKYLANLEAYEGMRVSIAQDMTITELFNLDRYGQYDVTYGGRITQFTQDNAPDVAGYDQHLQEIAARTLVLDDGLTSQNPTSISVIDGNDGVLTASDSFRMGDTITNISGVVSYSFGEYRIHAPTGDYSQNNPRPETPPVLEGNFKVANLNVQNYFTTIDNGALTDLGDPPRGADTPEEFDRQATKLVNAIVAMDAAVVGLVELENDFVGDTFAIKDLVARLNAALGSQVYDFVDPGQEFVGTDAIANGLIYQVDKVALQGQLAILETFEGRDFLDPLGAGRDLNRPAIAQTFEDLQTGQTLTVSVNHLKSKGSLSGIAADDAQGDGQGNNNATRTEAASILADWLASDPTAQGASKTLILGDLNAYANEDPLTALANAGYTDLAGDAAYSYVFDGQIGTLDYALANDALAADVAGVAAWHINADEADAIDYDLSFNRNPELYDGDTAARHSDHDPVIVSFDFDPVFNLIAGTQKRDVLFGTEGRDQIDAGRGNDVVFGDAGDDLINAGAGRDLVLSGTGDDTIDAGDGNDWVRAGDGDDVISAGGGRRDFLWGGDGADIFVFSAELAEDNRRDKVFLMDFDVTEDAIDLGGAVISSIRETRVSVRINLDGGRDRIDVKGVTDFDDIVFVEDVLIG